MQRRITGRIGRSAVAVVALAALTASMTARAEETQRPSGGKAVASRDGKSAGAGRVPVARTYSVGMHALEPTLGLTPGGTVFYAAAGFDSIAGQPGTQVLRSEDGGRKWENTSPRVLDRNTMPLTLDPYVYVDRDIDGDTGRVFTIDLTVACSYMSFSDDKGESWITNPLACGRPVNDHQTLFSGPPASSPTVGYPNLLYYCWNDVGSSACSKSVDGGISFHPTGTPAFQGFEPGNEDPGFFGVDGFCGGLHGHGAVGPDGSVYLPREYCGTPMLAISRDEGRTWSRVAVSKIRSTSQPREGAAHPSVAVDKKGNVYYMWMGAKDRLPYLAVSKDGGESWSRPVVAGPPGLKETNLPQITARGKGKIALVYYGSTNSPFPRCKLECTPEDYERTTWNGYVTISSNALAKNPLFLTGTVNDPRDPLIRRRCGPGRCQWAYDFIDVEIGNDGIAYGAFVDGCMDLCAKDWRQVGAGEYEGLVTKLVGGPGLN